MAPDARTDPDGGRRRGASRAAAALGARARAVAAVLVRTWSAPALWPVVAVATGASWLGTRLAAEGLGGPEGFVDEVRAGSLLFAGTLALSLAEPLEVGREARAGLLTLRLARGGGAALPTRWLALLLAVLPAVAAAALASGGFPAHPLVLLGQLAVLAAAGLLIGAWVDRQLLVPALWALLVMAHLRPWLVTALPPAAWVLPRLGSLDGPGGGLHALAWSAGALVLARARIASIAARG